MLYKFNGNFENLATIKRMYKENAPQVSDFETGTRPIPFNEWKDDKVEEYELREAIEEIIENMDDEDLADLYNSACNGYDEMIYDSYSIGDQFYGVGVLDIVRAFSEADPDDYWFKVDGCYHDYVTSSNYLADLIDISDFVTDIVNKAISVDCDEIERLFELDNDVALTSVMMSKRKWEDADGTIKTVVFVELEYEDGSDNRIDFDTLDDAFDTFCQYAELLDE